MAEITSDTPIMIKKFFTLMKAIDFIEFKE